MKPNQRRAKLPLRRSLRVVLPHIRPVEAQRGTQKLIADLWAHLDTLNECPGGGAQPGATRAIQDSFLDFLKSQEPDTCQRP